MNSMRILRRSVCVCGGVLAALITGCGTQSDAGNSASGQALAQNPSLICGHLRRSENWELITAQSVFRLLPVGPGAEAFLQDLEKNPLPANAIICAKHSSSLEEIVSRKVIEVQSLLAPRGGVSISNL